ncbi:MAG: alginate export family protein [Porticoccaceae bacterium]
MSRLLPVVLLCSAGIALADSAQADPRTIDTALKIKTSALVEGERDLGAGDFHTTSGGIIEITPQVRWQLTSDVSAFVRVRGFAQSDDFATTPDDNSPTRDNTFAEVRELWVDYGGLTGYPGEHLRLGRQRLRQDDGLWFDRDIESLRWIFDTTLVRADIGVAETFDSYTYKKDAVALPVNLDDRFNAFASVSYEWAPSQRAGLRALYADDSGGTGDIGALPTVNTKPSSGQLLWIGARVENGFYDYRRIKPVTYWTEVVLLTGTEKPTVVDPATGLVAAHYERDIHAWGGDFGLRVRPTDDLPLQIGAGYAFGTGGSDTDESDAYRQTGLHSNRSRFTGTRTLISRFGEVSRADLSNLSVISLFASLQFDTGDASLVFHDFRRDQSSAPVITDGIGVQPLSGDRDIGRGVDLVLSRYFDQIKNETDPEGDMQTALRLRVSLFDPGSAYASNADNSAYRIVLEGTVQF